MTVVTHRRRPLLLSAPKLFLQCWVSLPPLAWVVLPDHFHALLSPVDGDVAAAVHGFKVRYSRVFRGGPTPGRLWQSRLRDRVVRNEQDLQYHLDYIHLNPVRHGFCASPHGYAYSSLAGVCQARDVRTGLGG